MEYQKTKTKINKRKKISSKFKDNTIIISDKEKTVDSGEETNKQKVTDNLDIFDITQKIFHINVSSNSKKRIEISSAHQSNIDIVEDKDKSPTSDEPFHKSKKLINNSEYYQNNKDKINKKRKEKYQEQ